jgi:hypothetical protein
VRLTEGRSNRDEEVFYAKFDLFQRHRRFTYDHGAQALAKIERGHGRDLADAEAMLARGLISAAEVRAMYARVEPELYRFPAIDPPSFRRAVDAVFPP